jgi:hypothetical protein
VVYASKFWLRRATNLGKPAAMLTNLIPQLGNPALKRELVVHKVKSREFMGGLM